jgi:hypothetical protein
MMTSILPFDTSVQNVPGHPQWLPTVHGLPSYDEGQAAKRGDYVVVGGSRTEFFEPTWVWVW